MRTGVLAFALATLLPVTGSMATSNGTTRTYYIAADEIDWNYAPADHDHMTGKPYDEKARYWTEKGPDRIGPVYRKAVYREYTDASFATLKPRPAAWEHLGVLGPVIRGEVGDTIKVVFKNNARFPFSVHAHGVKYDERSAGVDPVPQGGDVFVHLGSRPERRAAAGRAEFQTLALSLPR